MQSVLLFWGWRPMKLTSQRAVVLRSRGIAAWCRCRHGMMSASGAKFRLPEEAGCINGDGGKMGNVVNRILNQLFFSSPFRHRSIASPLARPPTSAHPTNLHRSIAAPSVPGDLCRMTCSSDPKRMQRWSHCATHCKLKPIIPQAVRKYPPLQGKPRQL